MKFLRSLGYACQGIATAIKEQLNLKIHLLAVVLVTLAGFYFHITTIEWCLVLLCFGMVIAAELLNTAIEYLVDLVSPQQHPIAGKVKDIAAGAVLVTAIAVAIVAGFIFIKYTL